MLNGDRRPRIAVAGMAIESSHWAEARAGYRDFPVQEGLEVLTQYPFLAEGEPLRGAAEWIGVFRARSVPGGRVLAEVYEDFRARVVAGLAEASRDAPLDGILLDVHGAMSVDGMDDAEGDLVAAIRAEVGREVLIAATMDLHGNLSEQFVRAVELPTCYRLAPHEDAMETRERGARNLVAWLAREDRPVRAWVPVPILLPGEKTSTRVEPARSLYGSLAEVERRDGITDPSIWIGYAWADEPRCNATVIVTGDDEQAVTSAAEELATRLWDARADFAFVADTADLDGAIDAALAHRARGGARPYLVSDSGDNPGAGGSGDVTWTLTRLLERDDLTQDDAPLAYVASIFDAGAIDELAAHRIGDDVDVEAGARIDARVSGPVRIRGRLVSLSDPDPQAGRIAVIAVGGLRVIVTEFRKAFHGTADFASIGLPPEDADLIVTKIGYLEPTLYDVARGWTLALTPGPVDQDLVRLGHHRIRRPMFPFDPEATADLHATVLR